MPALPRVLLDWRVGLGAGRESRPVPAGRCHGQRRVTREIEGSPATLRRGPVAHIDRGAHELTAGLIDAPADGLVGRPRSLVPGWTAQLGRKARAARARRLPFHAVPVRAGQHHLALSYFPRLLPGLAVAMLALALLILLTRRVDPQVRCQANFPALRWTNTSLPTCHPRAALLTGALCVHLSLAASLPGAQAHHAHQGDRFECGSPSTGDPSADS